MTSDRTSQLDLMPTPRESGDPAPARYDIVNRISGCVIAVVYAMSTEEAFEALWAQETISWHPMLEAQVAS